MKQILVAIRELFFPTPVGTMLTDRARSDALDIIERHGLRAHYYLPAIGIENQELANACRLLSSAGYIVTAMDGTIKGKVAAARPTKDEVAAERRASFKLIKNG